MVAFLHKDPDTIPIGKSEKDPELRGRLAAFRDKASKSRLVKFWNNADELPGLVSLSLSKTIKMYPAVGWVRANQAASNDLLNEINELRKRKEELERQLASVDKHKPVKIEDLVSTDEHIDISGLTGPVNNRRKWQLSASWKGIFGIVSPHLLEHPSDSTVRGILARSLCEKSGSTPFSPTIEDDVYQTIKIQFQALGWIRVAYSKTVTGGMGLFWSLTDEGRSVMMAIKTIKASK